MKDALIYNIQKYSIHDGDGIRTTVFFKGCPLSCIWCHNPESQSFGRSLLYNSEKCTGCLRCVSKCSLNCIKKSGDKVETDRDKCICCGNCIDLCLNEAREIAGEEYSVDRLMAELEKDKMFYEESGGGITLSGGEMMSQDMDFIVEVLKKCERMGYPANIDTCGHVPFHNFQRVLPYTDTFLYDIKIMDTDKHKKYMGQGNELIFDNLRKLSELGAKIIIRLPLIDGINCDDQNIYQMIDFIKTLKVIKVNLLPYHNTGISKYDKLGFTYSDIPMKKPSNELLESIKEKFEKNNFVVKIGG